MTDMVVADMVMHCGRYGIGQTPAVGLLHFIVKLSVNADIHVKQQMLKQSSGIILCHITNYNPNCISSSITFFS